jgi:hypothetical protein
MFQKCGETVTERARRGKQSGQGVSAIAWDNLKVELQLRAVGVQALACFSPTASAGFTHNKIPAIVAVK